MINEISNLNRVDLSKLEPTVSGPKRPQDKILVKELDAKFESLLKDVHGRDYLNPEEREQWYSEGGSGMKFKKHPEVESPDSDVAVVPEIKHGLILFPIRSTHYPT